jgi:mannose-6-phosphate isomerase-like protein (cupin superfamily)
MVKFINNPAVIAAAGTGGKIIKEYIGRVNSNTPGVSIAHMNSPQGWEEPGQCPDFDEYTVVLKGSVQVKTKKELHIIKAGQGIITGRGEWVQYSTPFEGGAEYIAVCLPAFSLELVHRDQNS